MNNDDAPKEPASSDTNTDVTTKKPVTSDNASSSKDWRPLHSAVKRRRLDDVRDLLADGSVDVDAKGRFGRTPFDLAFSAGDVAILRALLESGADPNQMVKLVGRNRMPAVLAACTGDDEKLLELLLEFKASPNVKHKKLSPVSLAVLRRKENLLRLLLEHGGGLAVSDVIRHGEFRFTSLSVACFFGHLGIARLLLEAGASPNNPTKTPIGEMTPFAMACGKGDLDLVKLLLLFNVDVNKRFGETEETALMIALASNYAVREKGDIFRLLLSHGADIMAETTKGYTPLCAAASSGCVEAVRMLLGLLASIDQLDASLNPTSGKYSPLHSACSGAKHQAVEILLDAGSDVNSRCHDRNLTPLLVTVKSGADTEDKLRTIELLAARGADLNCTDRLGHTPLLLSCGRNTDAAAEIVELLLQKGAEVDARTNIGMTPLLAMCSYAVDVTTDHDAARSVGVLLAHGADTETRCNDPEIDTPFVEAIKEKRDETMDQLFDFKMDNLPDYDDD